ncbi:MAG: transpeptidase family protein [Spirochaetia bacterium]|nr:transpeptidase family protein [Spirochaetia bacterium]
MNNFFRRRFLIAALIFAGLIILTELAFYLKLALIPSSQTKMYSHITERGSIVDRNGKPLAVQTNFYNVGVSPKQIPDKKQFAKDVSQVLQIPESKINSKIDLNSEKNYVSLKRKISEDDYRILKDITDDNQYSFVRYDKIPGRIYPEKSLASQLIGYMGNDGIGLSGIEYSMQSVLQPIPDDELNYQHGKNVFLTIDANLQYKLEKLSHEAMEKTQCESFMLIACEAKTGEILSYISLPSSDLNNYSDSKIQETIDRPAISAFEPGSVFKIFTVASIYDHGILKSGDTFLCDGVYEKKIKGGETIRIKCLEHHGRLTAREALKYSCNDVIGQISDKISDEQFIQDLKNFGFGSKTGIELPGETSGLLKEAGSSRWSGRTKPTIAIGQEISVSALQMVQAATALANDGYPVQLSVIKKITNKDGSIESEHIPQKKERILKKSTADYILSCMETTATTGTGSRANIKDITIGVKTGTAQMADQKSGGYSDTDFLSNCMAIFPIDNPQVILYIVIQKAQGEYLAGRIVAPLIKDTADEIIDHLGLSRGDADTFIYNGTNEVENPQTIVIKDTVPDFSGFSKRELSPLLSRKDLKININGSGWVKNQSPAPGTPLTENTIIELNLE